MKITLERGDRGTYLLVAEDGRDVLVQVDWDFPGTATTFGWSLANIAEYEVWDHSRTTPEVVFAGIKNACIDYLDEQSNNDPTMVPHLHIVCSCKHDGTDGTIDCECGMKALTFIQDAQEYLDEHIGDEVDDPGYFPDDEGDG